MVSLGKIGIAFLCTHRFNHRLKSNQYINKYNRITPLNLDIPFLKTSKLLDDSSGKLVQDLSNKAIDVLVDESLGWEYGDKLSRLDINKRTSVLKETVIKWVDTGANFTVDNLFKFKDIVESLDLTYEIVYNTLLEILNSTEDTAVPPKVCFLCDVYKPKYGENSHFNPSNRLIHDENLNLYKLVKDIKESVLNKEFEKILDNELNDHEKLTPPNTKKSETNYELNKLRKLLIVSCSDYEKKINSLSKKKLIDNSIELNRLVWEYDFYNKFDLVEIPEHFLESVNEFEDFGTQTVNNLLYSRMLKVQNSIKNIVSPIEEVHIVKIHTYYLEKQYEYSLQKFNEWLQDARQKLDKLKECGLDLHRDHVYVKRIQEAGGEIPIINITPICPECPKLLEPDQLVEETQFVKKFTKEEKKQFFKDIEKTKEKLRALSHMSTEEMSNFIMRKVPGEMQIARKAKERRMRIRELNNPFNTSEDLPPFKQLKKYKQYRDYINNDIVDIEEGEDEEEEEDKEKENKEEKEITPYMSKEEVDEILSEINTEYIRHNMNLKHLEWHIKSSKANPRRSLGNLLDLGQDVKNPEPKKLSFEGDHFDETFEWLSEFVEDPNSEVHKYRRKLFYSASKKIKKDKVLTFKDIEKSKLQSHYLSEDPEANLEDDPIIEDLLKTGASLNCVMTWPYFEISTEPTEKQKESLFYKMSVSQPSPIYKCKKCDYRIFSHTVTTYEKKSITPTEYTEFTNEDEYKCKNCGADKSEFEEVWTTGAAKYKVPYMVQKVLEKEKELE